MKGARTGDSRYGVVLVYNIYEMTDLEKKLIECHYTERQRKVMEYYRRYERNVGHQPTYIQASQELGITMAGIYKAIRKFEKDGLLERNWRGDVKWLYEF